MCYMEKGDCRLPTRSVVDILVKLWHIPFPSQTVALFGLGTFLCSEEWDIKPMASMYGMYVL